jgi:WD40 repeat protein
VGQYPKATGALKVFELERGSLVETASVEGLSQGIKAVSLVGTSQVAVGDFKGGLSVLDLVTLKPVFSVPSAHSKIINCVDVCSGNGPTEILTGSGDGSVKLWDPRTSEPVVSLEASAEGVVDCWSVAFGDAHSASNRVIVSGYDNGDVKLFDLKTMTLGWEENVKNGVCHLAFDRKDIVMNKLIVSGLEGKFRVYDMRTYHPEHGYAGCETDLSKQAGKKSTVWGSYVLPQNREVFAVNAGSELSLFKYSYPDQRKIKAEDGLEVGVAGTVEMLNESCIGSQPCVGFDWHPGKCGLAIMANLDQCLRVVVATKLDQV